MPSQYTFTDYSSDWPAEFRREADRLATLLGDTVIAVHHIGSTAVPGLAAKPIIDLLPVVRDLAAVDERTPRMVEAGYRAWGEFGLPGRRYFTRDRGEVRTHNVHVYQAGDPAIERHVAFCEYLKSHPPACREYEVLKREAYARHPDDIAAYNDGKNAWIKRLEVIAMSWYRERAG
jgi:GrpB-like predicted nucleotidyltransferase (UPF0157 family)